MRLENIGRSLEIRPLPDGVSQIDWWGGRGALGRSDWPNAYLNLRKELDVLQPDLIHAGPIQSCAFLSALAGKVPLAAMSWGYDLLQNANSFVGSRTARYTLKRSDSLICDCETIRQKAVALGMMPEKTVVFPWGVDLNHFSPDRRSNLRAQLGWEDAFVVISTRSWEQLYGIDILLDGLTQAARQRPEMRILMLGSGSWDDRIEEWAQLEHLADRLHHPGVIPYNELYRYYLSADLYISASRVDGSSISLLEAMASGLPSLVSDIPGNREWVGEVDNGWLFKDGDANSLSKNLVAIADVDSERKERGRKAREVAVVRADWTVNQEKLQDAYTLAIEGAAQ